MLAIKKLQSRLDNFFSKFQDAPYIFYFLVFATIFVFHIPIKYIFQSPAIYTNTIFASEAFKSFPIINNLLLVIHIAAAIPAIISGPFLFIPKIRKSYPRLHRFFGQTYVIGCLISAVTVIPLALHNTPGTVAPYGFTPMAILWFTTTYLAYTAAINKDYVAHRRWILRSYAMTFAFMHVNMTFKLLLPYDQMSVDAMKAMQSMASWLINLFIIEIYLSATGFTGRFVGLEKWKTNISKYSKADRIYLSYKKPPARINSK